MVMYKQLDLQDKEWIDEIVKNSGEIGSEYPFVNNFLWSKFLELNLVDNKDFFTVFSNKKNAYLFPLIHEKQEDKNCIYLKKIINTLKDDAVKKSIPLKFYGVSDSKKCILENLFSNKFKFIPSRNSADYIYKIDDLVNLKGKKYHSKRNFINNFKHIYNSWEYNPLTPHMFDECLKIGYKWFEDKPSSDDILFYEVDMLNLAFKYFDQLGLFGGVIKVDGKIAGFSLGFEINNGVIDNVVEKALIEYNGIYSILFHEFLSNLPSNFSYVNREEDLGLENLRKSKLSLHPYEILNKYDAIWI